MRKKALSTAVRVAEKALGRTRVVKVARFVTNEIRLDMANDINTNGEILVQRAARTAGDPVVLDVGCHFGEWSASLLAQPGNTPTIHAFEPSQISAAEARKVLAGRASVHQFALSSTHGVAELQIVHDGAGSNSMVPFTQKDRASGLVEQIRMSTVDKFTEENGITEITLLKADAEGHDLEVLKGADRMLSEHLVGLVQFEYNLRWIDSRTFLLDAFNFLTERGYRMGKVTTKGIETYEDWHPELESFREGNYLAYLPKWDSSLRTFRWWGPA